MRRILGAINRGVRAAWQATRPVPLLTSAEFAREAESWRMRSGLGGGGF
jgi:hypothetical protein